MLPAPSSCNVLMIFFLLIVCIKINKTNPKTMKDCIKYFVIGISGINLRNVLIENVEAYLPYSSTRNASLSRKGSFRALSVPEGR